MRQWYWLSAKSRQYVNNHGHQPDVDDTPDIKSPPWRCELGVKHSRHVGCGGCVRTCRGKHVNINKIQHSHCDPSSLIFVHEFLPKDSFWLKYSLRFTLHFSIFRGFFWKCTRSLWKINHMDEFIHQLKMRISTIIQNSALFCVFEH